MGEDKEGCKNCGSQVYLQGGYCGKRRCLDVRASLSQRNMHSDMADSFHRSHFQHFFSLVQPKIQDIRKPCLRCQRIFVWKTRGNRICAECHEVNKKVGVNAIYGI